MPEPSATPRILPAQFAGLAFANTYAQLPDKFFSPVTPTPVSKPALIALNGALAEELNLDPQALATIDGIDLLAGNALPDGAHPIAEAYAGHQFGHFNPQLGDGRAVLLGDLRDKNGRYRDMQLKGAGRTPYSRNGDGRAAIGPVIREYMVSEAMHRLGIKTTRALAAVATGDTVYRQTALPGGVLTRVADSHIRIGTFEYFYRRGDHEAVRQLADYVIERHYPDTRDTATPYLSLLEAVIAAQAKLVAQWLQVGFIHGVMNTDNMSISGETIDYGPCAFMERYNPDTVYSSIDQHGRYAFGNQDSIALWNLTRLAECLLPLLHDDQNQAVPLAEDALRAFRDTFDPYWLQGMGHKLGFSAVGTPEQTLITELTQLLYTHKVDYTLGLRHLATTLSGSESGQAQANPWFALFLASDQETLPDDVRSWLERWHGRIQQEPRDSGEIAQDMNSVNPLYIPRNQRVEAVISAAVEQNDFSVMKEMIRVLQEPYTEQAGMEKYAQPAAIAVDQSYRTFCGT